MVNKILILVAWFIFCINLNILAQQNFFNVIKYRYYRTDHFFFNKKVDLQGTITIRRGQDRDVEFKKAQLKQTIQFGKINCRTF